MKKNIVLIPLLLVGGIAYLFFNDFQPVASWFGYNTSPRREGRGGVNFLNIGEGFDVKEIARNLQNPRVIAFDSNGRMLVSETKAGRILIFDEINGNIANEKRVLIDNLQKPHGLAFYTDNTDVTYLYIAETHQVIRYRYNVTTGRIADAEGENIANLPPGGRHFTRTIVFGKNFRTNEIIPGAGLSRFTSSRNKLYISVGSSCDACIETESWKRAAILESDPEGSYTAKVAAGLRNAVFFTFHPVTGKIWATEMGRDNLGEDLPPDEINIIEVNAHYGWPLCYGDQILDSSLDKSKDTLHRLPTSCKETMPPHIQIPAHSAPLGLAFVTEKTWPKEWQNDLLVAYHGSWNRREPTGYKIVRFDLDDRGEVLGVEDFISGWLSKDKKKIFGRPVDLKFGPDGFLYISDDSAGTIYSVKYDENRWKK